MPVEFVPDYEGIGELMRSPVVTDALAEQAHAVYVRARDDATSAGETGFAAALRVEVGVRPKGRPYATVIADDPAAGAVEFGSSSHPVRRRILGRAAGVVIYPMKG